MKPEGHKEKCCLCQMWRQTPGYDKAKGRALQIDVFSCDKGKKGEKNIRKVCKMITNAMSKWGT